MLIIKLHVSSVETKWNKMKYFIRCEVIADGSIQDVDILSIKELHRISEALGTVVAYGGEDSVPFLKLMRKVDKLLKRLEDEK